MPKRRKTTQAAVIAIIAGALISVMVFLGYMSPVINSVLESVGYLQNKLYSVSIALKGGPGGRSTGDLMAEIDQLNLKISDLQYRVAQMSHVEEENYQLRKILAYEEDESYQKIVARVIGRDPFLVNSLVINRGGNSGIKTGEAVVVGEGLMIGKVVSVQPTQATVLLITDNQLQVAVAKVGESAPLGVSEGKFGLSVIVDLIPQTAELEVGDLVVTSGLDAAIPAGLVLGSVNRIISDENELFKQVTIIPEVDPQRVGLVSVVTKIND